VSPAPSPLVSVVLAAHDSSAYLGAAVDSILRQTVSELELLVVDDASTDRTPDLLAAVDDARLVVLRNDERLGLARSLNRALERPRGAYVARIDADDVALPRRLERQLRAMRSPGRVGIVGSGVVELDAGGRPGRVHLMPVTDVEVRWHLLFGSPFFHPSVLLDRGLLERAALRYDPAFEESEDYDLWSRLLEHAEGVNVPDVLVGYRVHPGQATKRRRDVQRDFQRRVALREIGRVAPDLEGRDAELAWRLGSGEPVAADDVPAAADAYRLLLDRFGRGRTRGELRPVRASAARVLLRRGRGRAAFALDPALPVGAARSRLQRGRAARAARTEVRQAALRHG
jgi:glycosyltransferase involved in cell wall biosynthesis